MTLVIYILGEKYIEEHESKRIRLPVTIEVTKEENLEEAMRQFTGK